VAYILFNQGYPQLDQAEYALRTVGDPLSYASAVREIVRRGDAFAILFALFCEASAALFIAPPL